MTKLTVRLTEEEMKLLEKLKEISRESTYNKTFIFALKKALKFYDLREATHKAIENLQDVAEGPHIY